MSLINRPCISCSTGTLYHLPAATAFGIIRDAGFDGAEYVAGPESLIRGWAAIGRVAERSGLPVLSFHPPLYPFPGWPRDQKKGMLQVIEGAHALGGSLGVIHAPKGYSLSTPRAQQYVDGIDRAREKAVQHGITIGLETTQRPVKKRPMIFDDLDFFLHFTNEHDLNVTLDTSHAAANNDDLLDVLKQIGHRLQNIHFSDCRFSTKETKPQTHLVPGKGNSVDLVAFTQALMQANYTGLITLEISPTQFSLWSPRKLVKELATAREFVISALIPPLSQSEERAKLPSTR
jgi:sugar phosphate isomerase/epimerase